MDFYLWFGFLLAALGIAVSPGNGALLSMTHGLAYGFRATHITIAGLQVGLVLVMLISGLGLGALLSASELAFTALKIIGGLYLIYLGVQQIRKATSSNALDGMVQEGQLPSRSKRFWQGFLTDVTNAKGIVFMVAMMPQFISPARPLLAQVLILTATMVTVDLVVMHGYALLASRMARLLKSEHARTRLNRVFGSILIIVGLSVFFAPRG